MSKVYEVYEPQDEIQMLANKLVLAESHVKRLLAENQRLENENAALRTDDKASVGDDDPTCIRCAYRRCGICKQCIDYDQYRPRVKPPVDHIPPCFIPLSIKQHFGERP